MSSIAPPAPLASAAVVLFGAHGAVAALARQRGVYRQTLYREAHAVVLAVEGTATQQRLQELRQRLAELQTRHRPTAATATRRGGLRVDAVGDATEAMLAQAQNPANQELAVGAEGRLREGGGESLDDGLPGRYHGPHGGSSQARA